MNKKFVDFGLRYGGIVVMLSVLISAYLVMRNIELDRFNQKKEQQLQQLTARRQVMEPLLREFVNRAATDSSVLEILKKHQIVTVNQPSDQPKY